MSDPKGLTSATHVTTYLPAFPARANSSVADDAGDAGTKVAIVAAHADRFDGGET